MKHEENIKKMLKLFTDDFSTEDVLFIKSLVYPINLKVEDLSIDEDDQDNDGITVKLIENFTELESEFKKFPNNCKVTIPSITGKMILKSREDA